MMDVISLFKKISQFMDSIVITPLNANAQKITMPPSYSHRWGNSYFRAFFFVKDMPKKSRQN